MSDLLVPRETTDDVPLEGVELEFVDKVPGVVMAKWKAILTRLYDHPGQWARVRFVTERKAIYTYVSAINRGWWRAGQGRLRMTPPGIFRATVRSGQLYVCYCGPEPAAVLPETV